MFELRNGFENIPEVRKLFSEYRDMLVSLNPEFGKHLVLQNYEKEVGHPGEKYAPPEGRRYLLILEGCGTLRKQF